MLSPEWINAGLDLILIVLVSAGLVQAIRLIRHLAGLRASRAEMEKFVRDFNATVIRAESGIKALKSAAREIGDDLEKLVGRSVMVRDELQFIVESADQLADRIANAASSANSAVRSETKKQEPQAPAAPTVAPAPEPTVVPEPVKSADITPLASRRDSEAKPSSRAEKELMQALKKLN